jgi:hypothetical protein
LGEHNEQILTELGISDDDIAALYSEKVLVRDKSLKPSEQRMRSETGVTGSS